MRVLRIMPPMAGHRRNLGRGEGWRNFRSNMIYRNTIACAAQSHVWGQVIAHMMPDLPNVGWERDMESFAEFFENPAFRSDGLKAGPPCTLECSAVQPGARKIRLAQHNASPA